jgi:hypothetical protein
MTLADDQRRNRDTLVAQRQREAATLVSLKTDQAQVTAESRRVEADIGPLRYAAMLLGLDSEQALILLMVLCCDPMAIVLVIVASARRHAVQPREDIVGRLARGVGRDPCYYPVLLPRQ